MIEQYRTFADLAGFDRKLRWVLVVALAVAVSGLEALGALLIYVLLGMVTGVEGALELPVVGDVRDLLPVADDQAMLLWTAVAIAVFFVVRAGVVLAKWYVESRVTENAGARLSNRLVRGYLALPYEFHLRRNSAELIRNSYSTVSTIVRDVFRPAVKILSEGLVVLAILAVLLVTAPLATGLVVALVGPAALVLLRLVNPRMRQLGRDYQQTNRASLQAVQQALEGLRDIKVLGRERFFAREYDRARSRLARVRYRRDVVRETPAVGLETLLVLFIAGLFVATIITEGTAAGAVPVLGLFGYAALRLKPSLNLIVKSVNSLRFAGAGIDDVREDLARFGRDEPPPEADAVEPLPFTTEIDDGIGYGGRVGVFCTPNWQIEGDGQWSPLDWSRPGTTPAIPSGISQDDDLDYSTFALRINYNWPLAGMLGGRSSFLLGAGVVRTNYGVGDDNARRYTYNYGASGIAGIRFGLANRIALRFDGLVDYMPNSEPDATSTGTPDSPATARASSVFPVPGGPNSSTPFGIRAPSAWYAFGLRRKSTTSWRSSATPCVPATSSNVVSDLETLRPTSRPPPWPRTWSRTR
jgi:ABC-type multidrug transport system fused ATPase/permease subunit